VANTCRSEAYHPPHPPTKPSRQLKSSPRTDKDAAAHGGCPLSHKVRAESSSPRSNHEPAFLDQLRRRSRPRSIMLKIKAPRSSRRTELMMQASGPRAAVRAL